MATLSRDKLLWRIGPHDRVELRRLDPGRTSGLDRDNVEPVLAELNGELAELQELLYAAARHAVLLVLQGTDTSGKDGTISHVMAGVNPQGCRVTAFRAPTEQERLHDFLWRIHAAIPPRGYVGIFNRSHYEDVLFPRVHGQLTPDECEARYEHINQFERLLVDSGTIVIKCFLHVSKKEQAERLADREEDEDKRWKLDPQDYAERQHWDDYQQAYEALLSACSTRHAPWHVVPSDHKWYRNLAVAQTIVETLREYREEWRRMARERGARSYQAVLAARAGNA